VKRFILACAATIGIAGAVQLTMAASTDLSQAARAKIEDDLFRKLTPIVGVFDYVAFKLDADGTVTLMGQVRETAGKQRVEAEARKTDGIKQVRNQVEVLLLDADETPPSLYWHLRTEGPLATSNSRSSDSSSSRTDPRPEGAVM
jgi:hypothetical protein